VTALRAVPWRRLARWLPAPFMLIGTWYLVSHELDRQGYQLGIDAHIYYRGAVAWLHGSDPWNALYHGLHFAAPPWALPIIAPFTVVSESRAVAAWIALDAIAAVFIVRRAGLSWAWLLFPPLVHGTLNGNPAIVSLALLLAGAGPIGVLLRPQVGYALVGERRWRAIAIAAVLGIALLTVLPWQTFLADLPTITARYGTESKGGSTGGSPIALVVGFVSVLALATVDLREAGWLATIVAVPINGWYAGAAALPLLNPILGVGLAVPVVGVPTLTIALYVVARIVIRRAPGGWAGRILEPLVEPYRRCKDPAASSDPRPLDLEVAPRESE